MELDSIMPGDYFTMADLEPLLKSIMPGDYFTMADLEPLLKDMDKISVSVQRTVHTLQNTQITVILTFPKDSLTGFSSGIGL